MFKNRFIQSLRVCAGYLPVADTPRASGYRLRQYAGRTFADALPSMPYPDSPGSQKLIGVRKIERYQVFDIIGIVGVTGVVSQPVLKTEL